SRLFLNRPSVRSLQLQRRRESSVLQESEILGHRSPLSQTHLGSRGQYPVFRPATLRHHPSRAEICKYRKVGSGVLRRKHRQHASCLRAEPSPSTQTPEN